MFEPDYKTPCHICGETPTVTFVKKGEKTIHYEMCGPCTWGEGEMVDPNEWNE